MIPEWTRFLILLFLNISRTAVRSTCGRYIEHHNYRVEEKREGREKRKSQNKGRRRVTGVRKEQTEKGGYWEREEA